MNNWKFEVPEGYLISGFVIRYSSTNRGWYDCDRLKCNEEMIYVNNLIPTSQDLMMDIETVYVTNPINPTGGGQIYKPISFTTGRRTKTNFDGVFDVKFNPNYFLKEIAVLYDPRTNSLYGIRFGTAEYARISPQMTYAHLGNAWIAHRTSLEDEDSTNPSLYYFKVITPSVNGGQWVTSINGTQNSSGFQITDTKLDEVTQKLDILYPGDSIYNCCFLDGDCGKYAYKDSGFCDDARAEWCRKNPDEYSCVRQPEHFVNQPDKVNWWIVIFIALIVIAFFGTLTSVGYNIPVLSQILSSSLVLSS